MKTISQLQFLFLIILSSSLFSCKDTYTICDLPRTVVMVGSFYTIGSGQEVAVQPASLSVSNLDGSAILTNIPSPQTFSLYLIPNADSAKFLFSLNNFASRDTVTIKYSTQSILLSQNCGNINTFTITQVSTTKNTLDSIAIADPLADNRLSRNIKLYY